jgi:hypothetical protein
VGLDLLSLSGGYKALYIDPWDNLNTNIHVWECLLSGGYKALYIDPWGIRNTNIYAWVWILYIDPRG